MFLSEIKTGGSVSIESINDEMLERKLKELGIFCGARILLKARIPSGCPLIFEAENVLFGIRKADAAKIMVKKID
jgi:Fe2+ transport system protein FeoA